MTTFTTSIEIGATVEQVYDAIQNPERLARWWGPDGFTNTFQTFDFQEGGRWEFTMHGPDGRSYPNESLFARIEPPHKVVVRHLSPPPFLLTLTLTAADEGTIVDFQQAFEDDELARRLEPIVVPANRQNLERLAAEVRRGSAGS